MRITLAALALATALPLVGALPRPAMAQQAVVVRSGETLSEIADRHGVSLNRLMQANGITTADLVQVGQRLIIPGAGSTASRPAATAGGTYTVKDGETLSEIADRQGIGLNRLMQANGISNANLVQVGQRLTIPGSAAVAARPSQPTAPYTVKSGETLSDIAARFDTSTDRLIQINGIRDPNLVMSGTRLQVPMVPGRRPSATTTTAAAPAKARSTAPSINRQASDHTVQSGESLSLIAERYGTSVDKLVALNQLDDPALLQVGTRLKLRGTPPTPRPASSAAPLAAKATPAKQPTVATAAPASVTKPVQAMTTPLPSRLSQATTAVPSTSATTATTSATTTTAATTTAAAATAQTKAASATTAATSFTPTKPSTASTSALTSPAIASRATPSTAATATATATRAASPRPVTAAVTSRSSNSGSLTSARPASGDWRSYGPLQVDWSNLQPMGGSFVAPSVNGDGQTLYVAVNCTARKLNVTSQAGQWKAWETPGQDFEQRLVQDICLAKAS